MCMRSASCCSSCSTGSRLYRASEPRALEAEILRGDLQQPSDVAEDKPRASALRGDLDA